MTMQFDPEPEVDDGSRVRRRWVAALLAAMLVAAAGGVGFGLGYALGDDGDPHLDPAAGGDGAPPDVAVDGADADAPVAVTEVPRDVEGPASTDAEPAPTDPAAADPEADAADGTAVVDDEHAADVFVGFDPWAPMETVYTRTTPAGLSVRLQLGAPWPDAEPWVENGWVQPGWCNSDRHVRIAVTGDQLVDVTGTTWFDELFRGRMASVLTVGHADGRVHRIVVVQVTPDVTEVAAVFGDGATDRAGVENGLAVLVAEGVAPDSLLHDPWQQSGRVEFELTLVTAEGSTTISRAEADPWANPDFRASCEPPPPSLPEPGEPPADPAAAEAEIRAAMTALYGSADVVADGDRFLDDSSGVADARAQVAEGSFAAEAASAEPIVEELVFTSPSEAWFRYRVETSGIGLDGRYGVAIVLVGAWRITRDTVCQDLSIAGGDCGDWSPVVLPSAG